MTQKLLPEFLGICHSFPVAAISKSHLRELLRLGGSKKESEEGAKPTNIPMCHWQPKRCPTDLENSDWEVITNVSHKDRDPVPICEQELMRF